MPQYGHPVSTPVSPASDSINSGTCRATSYRPFNGYGWATSVGGHVGRFGGEDPPTFRYGVHKAVSGSPDERVAYTEQLTVNSFMLSGDDGVIINGDFVETTQAYSPRNDALALWDGVRYSISANPNSGEHLRHGYIPAHSISEAYENFYEKTGVTVPPNPFNETTVLSGMGWMSLWINYVVNLEPEIPVNRTPVGTITDTTPHMQGDFRDHHGEWDVDYGDRMTRFHVQVREVGQTSLKWDSNQTASSTEIANNRFDTIYAGSALVAGHDYEWRCRVADWFGVWSAWSEFLAFDIPSTGSTAPGVVTLDANPFGQINVQTGIVFEGHYTHSAALAMDQVQIELWQAGVKIDDSGAIAKSTASSAAPGTLFSITQTEANFPPVLSTGAVYQYRMRVRATNGVWSSYTALRTFSISSPPYDPVLIDPTGGEAVTTLPLLQCEVTDPDGEVGLFAQAHIMTVQAVTNGNMNGNVTGWSAINASGVTAALSYDAAKNQDGVGGSGKLDITASTAATDVLVSRTQSSQVIPCVEGEGLVLSGYLQTSSANLRPTMTADFYSDAAGTVLVMTIPELPTGAIDALNTWTYHELGMSVPFGAISMRVGYGAISKAANVTGTIWGDHILLPGFTSRYMHNMTYEGAGLWSYQTTSTDIPAFGTYNWKVRGYDGNFYSGFTQTSFKYASGPVVTMLTPTANQVITTNTPNITWSVADQQRFQVFIYNQTSTGGTGDLIFQSDEEVDTVSSYILPAGILRNGGVYRVRVKVWDSLNLDGLSPNRNFSVNYGAVVPLTNFFASPYSLKYDPRPSAVLLTWDLSYYPSNQHEAYAVYRREATQPVSYNLMIGRFTSVAQTSFIDYQPKSRVEYIYTVTQMVKIGTEVIESVGVQAQVSIDLAGTTITAADDGDTYRIVCQFWSDRGVENNTDGNQILPWGATKPTMMFGSAYFKTLHFTARFVNTDLATIQQMSLEADRLLARRGIVCFRDPPGRLVFGVLSKTSEADEAMGTLRTIEFQLTEVNYTEAV